MRRPGYRAVAASPGVGRAVFVGKPRRSATTAADRVRSGARLTRIGGRLGMPVVGEMSDLITSARDVVEGRTNHQSESHRKRAEWNPDHLAALIHGCTKIVHSIPPLSSARHIFRLAVAPTNFLPHPEAPATLHALPPWLHP
jgi:hypothetical protein